jgi:hypothetical protein
MVTATEHLPHQSRGSYMTLVGDECRALRQDSILISRARDRCNMLPEGCNTLHLADIASLILDRTYSFMEATSLYPD